MAPSGTRAIERGIDCSGRRAMARTLLMLPLLAGLAPAASLPHPGGTPVLPWVRPNPNVQRAGVLRDGVLTVTLEARESLWRLNGPDRPPMTVEAFSEPGKTPLVPGPLLRAPAGTEIRLSLRNSLPVPLTFLLPVAVHGGPDRLAAMDSVVVAPGSTGQLTTRATTPGNYVYRATTPAGTAPVTRLAGVLGGALVVDTAGAPPRPNDRVFVIMATPDSAAARKIATGHSRGFGTGGPNGFQGIAFTINGLSWPNTERIPATAGGSLHWRVINASAEFHPMHLHGFYYRVDAFDGPYADRLGRPGPGQMVVTQLLSPWAGMSMTWSPDRPGNWIFHCHFALHLMPQSRSATLDDPHMGGMAGLVLAVEVADRPGVRATRAPMPARRLRLVAIADSLVRIPNMDATGHYRPEPAMHFVLEEHGRRVDTRRAFGPELDLTRGEPVAITIVNHLPEPTSVHWHGIEIQDSYMDGVPGVSGEGRHLTPEIVPGDSFEARFTPPRSGTFMYHAHVDEPREEQAGLEGALIVRDPGAPPSLDDHVFFFKGGGIDGEENPDTVVLHAGRPARLRLLNLANWESAPSFSLTARPDSALVPPNDTMLVRWRPLAKDGFDLPATQRGARPARQAVSMGETYDFEYTPERAGSLRLELRENGPHHKLLFRVPIRVESADVSAAQGSR